MNFGTWIREHRKEKKLDILPLAQIAGVSEGTISRIENDCFQATVDTAVRLCIGLGLNFDDFIEVLYGGKHELPLGRYRLSADSDKVLTIGDVKAFVKLEGLNHSRAASLLKEIVDTRYETVDERPRKRGRPKTTGSRETGQPDAVTLDMPPSLNAEEIRQIYLEGGILTFGDAGAYLRGSRHDEGVSLQTLQETISIPASSLGRWETASASYRMKLSAAMKLDELLGKNGELIAIYWAVGASNIEIAICMRQYGQHELSELKGKTQLTYAFVTASRWWQSSLGFKNNAWLKDLRQQLKAAAQA